MLTHVIEEVQCEICTKKHSVPADWMTLVVPCLLALDGWYFCSVDCLKTWFFRPNPELPPAMLQTLEAAKAYLATLGIGAAREQPGVVAQRIAEWEWEHRTRVTLVKRDLSEAIEHERKQQRGLA